MAQRSSSKSRRSARPAPPPITWRNVLFQRAWLALSGLILVACGIIGFAVTLGAALLLPASAGQVDYEVVETNRVFYAESPVGPDAALSSLSTVFTPEVQYWAELIKAWAVVYQVDPNLIATLIQIESCGDPSVSSYAGAQGLFQVMPFHFESGEDMLDVQTNARRGMNYLVGGLERSDGHAGLALAGYNGGHGVIGRGWAGWSAETRRYYYWGSRIYAEAVAGMTSSPTLQEWLTIGGQNLCAQANQTQQALEQAKAQAYAVPPSSPPACA
jgi:hypothetical protein